MIKILRQGNTKNCYIAECPECNALISFNKTDTFDNGALPDSSCIQCPCCDWYIEDKFWKEIENETDN